MSDERKSASPELQVLELSEHGPRKRYDATTGMLVQCLEGTDPVVEFEDTDGTVVRHHAATTVELDSSVEGHPVLLMFLGGDRASPVITGLLAPGSARPKKISRTPKLELDAKELLLEADSQITLKCGKSSITLTRDGRIILKGKHLLSRATSVNRIRGGVIQLN